jgi:hypothetical protein
MAHPLHTLDQATQRIDAESLDLKGIKTLRVLNESKFLSILERMVEERLRVRLASVPVGSTRDPAEVKSAVNADRERRGNLREERVTATAPGLSPDAR